MLRLIASIAVLLATSPLLAQANRPEPLSPTPSSKVKKSLADGLVRQCIERDGLKPPRIESGLEMAAGKGPIVFLVRRANGTFEVEALPRGRGDHGPAAEIAKADVVEVEELVEKAAPAPKPAAKPNTLPEPQGNEPQGNKLPSNKGPAKLSITHSDDLVTVVINAHGKALAKASKMTNKAVGRAELTKQLRQCLARSHGTKVAAQLLLEASTEARMQDVLACWEIARAVGFTNIMWLPTGPMRQATDEERTLIAGLAKRFHWQADVSEGRPFYDGELLILLDGPTRFRDVRPLILLCAKHGIWQIAFAGQDGKSRRFKLPTHLPYDR